MPFKQWASLLKNRASTYSCPALSPQRAISSSPITTFKYFRAFARKEGIEMATPGRVQPTHSDCAYFKDGFCTLKGVPVDAGARACPDFVPKRATYPSVPAPPMPLLPRFQPPVPPLMRPWGPGVGAFSLGLRRRHRHRRRHGHGWR